MDPEPADLQEDRRSEVAPVDLEKNVARTRTLIETIDKTISRLNKEDEE